MQNTRSLKIAKKVMKLLKKETKSSHDIISFDDLPFFYRKQLNNYINRFGYERISAYLKHTEQTHKIRTLIQTLLPIYEKTTASPNSLFKVATTLCGYGECDETSQRAAMELLAMGCEEAVNLIILQGKPCVANPNPENITDYYCHMIIVIGSIQKEFNTNASEFFKTLSDSHILFDASLKIIGAANKTTELLKSVFKNFEISEVAQAVEIKPPLAERVAYAKAKLAKAKEFSEVIMKLLNMTTNKISSYRDMFFSYPEKKYKKMDSKPVSLLIDDKDRLDWESCMKRFKQ